MDYEMYKDFKKCFGNFSKFDWNSSEYISSCATKFCRSKHNILSWTNLE